MLERSGKIEHMQARTGYCHSRRGLLGQFDRTADRHFGANDPETAFGCGRRLR